ncbi:MAG: hypothetical protein AAGK01_09210 [Pseudomonadota bacterium]
MTELAKASMAAIFITLMGCAQSDGDAISTSTEPYDGISANETLYLLGTEPFWGFEINGESAEYSSPEELDGTTISLKRFAGNSGLGYSGEINDQPLQIAITPGDCSDGMSDRSYPFTATVTLGDSTLYGCGHTDSQPFTGDEAP